jgi:hypothetical protein
VARRDGHRATRSAPYYCELPASPRSDSSRCAGLPFSGFRYSASKLRIKSRMSGFNAFRPASFLSSALRSERFAMTLSSANGTGSLRGLLPRREDFAKPRFGEREEP